MRSTHATEIKINTHVYWTLSFEFVKKNFCIWDREYRIFFTFHKNEKF